MTFFGGEAGDVGKSEYILLRLIVEKLKQNQFDTTSEKHEREHVHVLVQVIVIRQKRPVGHEHGVNAHIGGDHHGGRLCDTARESC